MCICIYVFVVVVWTVSRCDMITLGRQKIGVLQFHENYELNFVCKLIRMQVI